MNQRIFLNFIKSYIKSIFYKIFIYIFIKLNILAYKMLSFTKHCTLRNLIA